MADPPQENLGHLPTGGSVDVVYCHQCRHEWYHNTDNLSCPRCRSEAIEIITPENDPRTPPHDPLENLRSHDPWQNAPDPDEDDIEDYSQPLPRATFSSRTFRNGRLVAHHDETRSVDLNHPIHDFHSMLGTLIGPASGSHRDEAEAQVSGPGYFGTSRQNGVGPRIIGGQVTFINGRRASSGHQPDAGVGTRLPGGSDDFITYAPRAPFRMSPGRRNVVVLDIRAHPDAVIRILRSLFGPEGWAQATHNQRHDDQREQPPSLQGLFAAIFSPAHAVAGDAVYSQEALDRIISNLMEQHPTSNAPGPASSEAIANLQKKKLDEKMLGPELKAECSVCMDDVHLNDEVVVLPCTHWFHEPCAAAWLREHNTCPICRTGIGENSRSELQPVDAISSVTPSINEASHSAAREHVSRSQHRRPSMMSQSTQNGPRRYQIIGDGSRFSTDRVPPPTEVPPRSPTDIPHIRRRETDDSEGQREPRRRIGSSGSGGPGTTGGPLSWLSRRFSGGGSYSGGRRQE